MGTGPAGLRHVRRRQVHPPNWAMACPQEEVETEMSPWSRACNICQGPPKTAHYQRHKEINGFKAHVSLFSSR
jgi:hypothetical protein